MADITAALPGQEHYGDQRPPCAEYTIVWNYIEIWLTFHIVI